MNQSELHFGPEPGPDVFDMDSVPQRQDNGRSAPTSNAPAAGSQPAGATKPLRERISGVHVGSLVMLIAGAWIFWPQSGASKPNRLAAPVPQAVSQSRPHDNARDSETASSARGADTRVAAPANADSQHDQTAVAADAMNKQILEEQAKQATALIEAINAMNARLTLLEHRVSTHPPANATPEKLPAASSIRAKRQQRALPVRTVAAPAAEGGFTLNTIFRDQAWVTSGDQIHIVTAGDRLGGLTVTRIDAAKRQVVTSGGVIR